MIQALACAAAWAGAVDALPSVVGEPGQPPEDAILGDLDGDGASELVVAVPSADLAGHEAGMVAWVPAPRDLAPLSLLADNAALVLTGEAPQDHAGAALVIAGDLDGDGYDDLAIGAPDASTASAVVAGKIYLAYGGAALAGPTASLGNDAAADGIDRFDGGAEWGRIGERIFAGGDPDGNGTGDLLVGAPVPTPDGETGTGWLGLVAPFERGVHGVLALRFGPGLTTSEGLAAAWLVEGTGTLAGRSAAVVADTNGDGRDEIVLGAPGIEEAEGIEATRGAAFLFLGPSSDALSPPAKEAPVFDEGSAVATVTGRDFGDAFPWSISAVEDGVLFAVPEEDHARGAVYVFASLSDGTTDDADRAIHGAGPGDLFALGVADARGLVDDAFLLVGAPGVAAGTGTVVLTTAPQGATGVGSVALGSIDGCWTDGELGHSVRSHTDDEGTVLAMSAPFASVYGETDGVAAVLDPSRLDAFDAACTHGDATIPDADGDGTPASLDCDDDAAWRNPQALEVCGDGIDDDCDGEADEDCGPPLEAPGCSGCASSRGSAGAVLAVVSLAFVRRRALPLILLPLAARAQDVDALERAEHRLWGSAANEYLHGPVASFEDGLAVANFQGIQQAFAVGEVALVEEASIGTDVLLAGAPVTLHGSSEHDYFGVAIAADGPGLVVGIDHTGLTENDPGEVALFRDPWDRGPTVSATRADLRLEGEHKGDSFGTVLDFAGDLDGDGARDLVIGAPTFSYGRDVPERPDDCDDWAAPTPVSGAVYVVHRGLADLDAKGIESVAVREHCAPDSVADESIATAVIQAPDPDETTFFGARLVATDLDDDGYGDLAVASWGADTSGTVSFFPGPIAAGDLALTRDDAAGTLRSGEPASFAGWALAAAPDGSAIAVGSQDARLWIVRDAPSGSVDLGAPIAAGAAGSGFATSLAWGPSLLVGAPFAGEVHVLDGATFDSTAVLGGAPSLGTWVGWIEGSGSSALPDAVLTAPEATHNLEHQGVALVLAGDSLLERTTRDESCGCANAPADPFAAISALVALARRRRYSQMPVSSKPPGTPAGRFAHPMPS
jgi:hypothetical protein